MFMKIKDMFNKDIERPISGVIKVAQDELENIKQELDEYVVTQEINRHLGKFYDNYLRSLDGPTDKIGVWISGFFGSGKSHFLKILSYLLENKIVDEKEATEYFNDKIEDKLFLEDMRRAGRANTEVILFNIDAKSPMSGKSEEETLLKIFLKMFHNHQGFYGDIPGIAYMEKYLTEEGKYEIFKEEFKKSRGNDWVDRRRTFRFDRDHIIKALSKATGMSEETAKEWHQNGSRDINIDIEGFAKEVKEYLDSKGKDSRLVFLVDEVGQYIGEDSTLMLNLQTIAEELGTHCQGRAWIIVTSQEAIDELAKKVREDDFSKIQGRFDTRLSLSSISVDEVIIKRILEKKYFVEERLKQIYFEKSAILNNLIIFNGASSDFLGYEDENQFAAVYPFIPYQFKLLQKVFEQVRRRGSSGKHLSEGERSMLSAFKESAIHFMNENEGVLIPFYAFYDTIYEFLTPSIRRVIDGAERNPALRDDSFNTNLLKALFMIKYVDELPSNVENLAVLMATNIDEDKISLKQKIIKSLGLLESQYLIQKNGDTYIFLTDDEQDVNKDLKQIAYDDDELKKELREYVFNQFYENRRYRYSPQYDFDFNKKMDEKNHGNQLSDIGINVLSPLSDNYKVPDVNLMLETKDTGEMIIKLGDDEDFNYIEDLKEILRVKQYVKTINFDQIPSNKRVIITAKQEEEIERRKRVRENLELAIKNSTIFINGEKMDIRGGTVKDLINNGMKALTESVYTKLSYIKSFINNTNELQDILNDDSHQMSLDVRLTNKNELAILEVYNLIKLEDEMNKQIRVKPIVDMFKEKPYGWNELDILGIILRLLKDQKINLRYQGNNLTANTRNLVQNISKSSEQDRIIITIRKEIDIHLLRKVKEIAKELWNKTDIRDDEDGLADDIRALIEKQIEEIKSYLHRYEGRKYPGKSLLEKGLGHFEGLQEKIENIALFKQIEDMEDTLIIWEEDMAYVKSFFSNQKDIFDSGLRVRSLYEENSVYLTDTDVMEAYENLTKVLEDYLPYGKIKDIPEYVSIIDEKISEILRDKKQEANKQVEGDLNYLNLLSDHQGVKETTIDGFTKTYNGLKRNIEGELEILKIEGIKTRSSSFRTTYEQQIIREIDNYKSDGDHVTPPDQPERDTIKINLRNITNIRSIRTEEQVEIFLAELGKILKQKIKDNDIEFID